MKTEEKVEITKEPSLTGQFGKERLPYNSARTSSSKTVIVSCTGLLVAVVIMTLSGSPKKEREDQVSHFLHVDIPVSNQRTDKFSIPSSNGKEVVVNADRGKLDKRVSRYLGPEVVSRPRKVQIPPGSMVEAVLITGASNGPVKAELKEPLMVLGETILDVGTMLIGTGQSGNERLMIHFKKAVFRDGTQAEVSAQAADSEDKISGIKGNFIGYRALKLAADVGLNFAAGLSQGLQETQGQNGALVTKPTMKNALLNGAGKASIEEGQNIMNEYRNEKPVIEVQAGTRIVIIFEDPTS